MALSLFFICFTLVSLTLISGDFLSDLDKLDIDTKLREIDKAINAFDHGDDSILDKVKPTKPKSKPKIEEDDDPTDFGSAVEMLAGMFGGGECIYECKNGNNPVPKTGHVPTSNGCGSSGIKIDTDDIPGMEDCCHEHDYCYDTCNSDRNTCDKEFKKCLHGICNKKNTSKNKKKVSYKDCKTTADLMYSGTVALGCDAFLSAQEKACSCRKTVQSETDRKLNQKSDIKKKPSSDTIRNDKKDRHSSGRRNDEL